MTDAEQTLITKLSRVIDHMEGYPEKDTHRTLIAKEDIRIILRSYVIKSAREVSEQWLRDNPDYMKQYKQG